MNGFYAIYYTGISGYGNAVMIVKDGVISGADVAGGLYDGTFSPSSNGFSVDITLRVPAGTTLVTGQTLTGPVEQKISGDLPSNFSDGQSIAVSSSFGPVNAIFKKLRDLA